MSKIIEALEKARVEGSIETSVGGVDERVTLAPVAGDGAHALSDSRPKDVRLRKSHSGVAAGIAQVEPAVLERVDPHIVVAKEPMSVISEQYRSLRSKIERLNFDGQVRTLGVTSAVKGEGKSLTACNLAVVLAQDASKRILLVDADLRSPNVHQLLGLSLGPGLAEVLSGQCRPSEVFRQTGIYGLEVLTAGTAEGLHPSELLASPEFSTLVARWRREFDYVLFDCPPIHPISDVSFLVEAIDGAVLVVRAKKTSKDFLQEVLRGLPQGKVIGTLLNRTDELSDKYGYKKGYGYGYYGYGDSGRKG